MKRYYFQSLILLIILSRGSFALADPGFLTLSLKEAQNMALENSDTLRSARYLREAALDQSKSSQAQRWPRADLSGRYFYQTHVPYQNSPSGAKVDLGDNRNYTIGPIISYTLFDAGKADNNYHGSRLRAQASSEQYQSTFRSVQLATNLAYARAQLAACNLSLTHDALMLASNQSADVDLRYKVGTASKLDQLAAHKDSLDYQLLFLQSQNQLAAALRDLVALTGGNSSCDLSRPLPSNLKDKHNKTLPAASAIVELDDLNATLSLRKAEAQKLSAPGDSSPMVKALELSSQASVKASQSQKGANWPQLSLSAESRFNYPDTSIKDDYVNNIFSLNVSFPIWDGSLNSKLASKLFNESKSLAAQKEQTLSDLKRDYLKITDAMQSLERQHSTSQTAAQEAEELAELTYHSYSTGKSTWLEVQNANLKLMQARVRTAQIEYELLVEIADLEYRAGQGKE